MDRQHFLPLGVGELLERMDDLDACVADQDVDAGKGIDHAGDALAHRSLVGDIHGDADGLTPAGADLRSRGLRRVPVEIGNGYPGALARKKERDVLADAACRAGDEGNLVFEFHAGPLVRWSDGSARQIDYPNAALDLR